MFFSNLEQIHRQTGIMLEKDTKMIQSILDIRSKLRDAAQSDTLAQFHTTLVASLIGPNGGFAIHIGDGAIFTGNIKKDNKAIRHNKHINLGVLSFNIEIESAIGSTAFALAASFASLFEHLGELLHVRWSVVACKP